MEKVIPKELVELFDRLYNLMSDDSRIVLAIEEKIRDSKKAKKDTLDAKSKAELDRNNYKELLDILRRGFEHFSRDFQNINNDNYRELFAELGMEVDFNSVIKTTSDRFSDKESTYEELINEANENIGKAENFLKAIESEMSELELNKSQAITEREQLRDLVNNLLNGSKSVSVETIENLLVKFDFSNEECETLAKALLFPQDGMLEYAEAVRTGNRESLDKSDDNEIDLDNLVSRLLTAGIDNMTEQEEKVISSNGSITIFKKNCLLINELLSNVEVGVFQKLVNFLVNNKSILFENNFDKKVNILLKANIAKINDIVNCPNVLLIPYNDLNQMYKQIIGLRLDFDMIPFSLLCEGISNFSRNIKYLQDKGYFLEAEDINQIYNYTLALNEDPDEVKKVVELLEIHNIKLYSLNGGIALNVLHLTASEVEIMISQALENNEINLLINYPEVLAGSFLDCMVKISYCKEKEITYCHDDGSYEPFIFDEKLFNEKVNNRLNNEDEDFGGPRL